jgi:peptide/nickel transport system permease protein
MTKVNDTFVPSRIDEATATISPQTRNHSWPGRATRRLAQIDLRLIFAGFLALITLGAIFAPFLTPYNPTTYNPNATQLPPSLTHLLGTDSLGRDQFSRVLYGARVSLSVGISSILISTIIGTAIGIIAAHFRGIVDRIIGIFVDGLLAFPSLILTLAIAATLGQSLINVGIAIAIVRIPLYIRLARGQAMQITVQPYIEAARLSGSSNLRIMYRHILPNIISPLMVQAALSVSFAILDESVLSFIGLGVTPPTPEWGLMVSDAQSFLRIDPWMMMGPTLAITMTVLSLNIVGDVLRDRLDPRSASRIARK